MNTPKEQKRGKLLDLKIGAQPKFCLTSGPVDDCNVSMTYTAYEDGSRTIRIVGDSTGIKTTLHLKIVWMPSQEEDEQNPYLGPDHNFNYVQTYAAEARFAAQFPGIASVNFAQIYASASHD